RPSPPSSSYFLRLPRNQSDAFTSVELNVFRELGPRESLGLFDDKSGGAEHAGQDLGIKKMHLRGQRGPALRRNGHHILNKAWPRVASGSPRLIGRNERLEIL